MRREYHQRCSYLLAVYREGSASLFVPDGGRRRSVSAWHRRPYRPAHMRPTIAHKQKNVRRHLSPVRPPPSPSKGPSKLAD
ncbi:hypothetical protein Trydic_g15273 [Trypoxylus dichotomus]